MNLKRVLILLTKELANNFKSFMMIYIIVVPVVLSLIVALVFGDLFSQKPNLGFVDAGNSQFTSMISDVDFVKTKAYTSDTELRKAVENGAVDIGVVVPPTFDSLLKEGAEMPLSLYVWGESMLKNRIILTATLSDLITTISGREMMVSVEPVLLGENDTLPLQERLLPMLVLMTVVLSGMMIPALSLVEEKQNRTLKALVVTPTSLEDVFVAKGAFGVITGMVMACIVLVLNQAMSTHPEILLLVLFIGAVAAAAFGLFFASFTKDMTTLMAIVKATGILLYAPGLLQIFPDIPSWIAKIFPTYYLIGPVIEVTQKGGGWSDITTDLTILIVITLLMVGGASAAIRRLRYQPT